MWDQQRRQCRFNDIFEIEAIGPLILLHNFGEYFTNALWVHFIDNDAAMASLINGSSSVGSGDVIVGATWSSIASHNACPWFDRVESESNPVDGLSRGRTAGPWQLRTLTFPPWLIPVVRSELL